MITEINIFGGLTLAPPSICDKIVLYSKHTIL